MKSPVQGHHARGKFERSLPLRKAIVLNLDYHPGQPKGGWDECVPRNLEHSGLLWAPGSLGWAFQEAGKHAPRVPTQVLKELTCRFHSPRPRCSVAPVGVEAGWLPTAAPVEALGKPRAESERMAIRLCLHRGGCLPQWTVVG